MIQENSIYKTKHNGSLKVIKRDSYRVVHVEFVNTGYKTTARSDHILNGSVFDPLSPSVCGVGFLGVGEYSKLNDKVAYQKWNDMLSRCYSNKFHNRCPTYIGCFVCDEWHNFQVFAKWFYENNVDGYELDKDIKIKGNKAYGPDTCLFLPSQINSLLAHRVLSKGTTTVGVSSQKGTELLKARLSIDGKVKNLGYFETEIEANNAYIKAKNSEIMRKCDQYPEFARYLVNHLL